MNILDFKPTTTTVPKIAFRLAKVNTITIQGIEALNVEVQICLAPGIPCFNIVGLPDKIVAESKERVRAAITAIGLQFPPKRITVNLAPANIFKIGNHYDLPIALGIISLIQEEDFKYELENYIVMGELALDGNIMEVCSVLPAAIYANQNGKGIVCPWQNGIEARISKNKSILAVRHLNQALSCLNREIEPEKIPSNYILEEEQYLDIKDVKGQESAKRALEIAAAGGHHILMQGPPGTGKSMLAKRINSILPPLSRTEILEINLIASITGKFKNLIYRNRPFRDPHHSCSMASMVGGGKFAEPGEITLAHNGLLFLDELPEFPRVVIEALRQPVENQTITVSRVNAKATYPANFQLIAAMNPCKCGHLGSNSEKTCKYAPSCGIDYRNKISGPILDRFDIFVEVSTVDVFQIYDEPSETSAEIRKRVTAARALQARRYNDFFGKGDEISDTLKEDEETNNHKEVDKKTSRPEPSNNWEKVKLNAHMTTELIEKFVKLDEPSIAILKKAVGNHFLSMRGYNKVLKIARNIADLEGSEAVTKPHITEALYYRLNSSK